MKPSLTVEISKCEECPYCQYQAVGSWWMCSYPLMVNNWEQIANCSNAIEQGTILDSCMIQDKLVVLNVKA